MISFEEACEIISKFYFEAWKEDKLESALDLGDSWIIYPAVNPMFGMNFFSVSKEDGSMKPFILPNRINFDLLKNAKEMEIPKQYRKTD